MRKLLSIALAVLLLVSCMSVGITSIATALAADKNVTTSVLQQNGLNGGYITSDASQSIAAGSQATVSAVPYYGNTFDGWYDGETLVSTNATYTFTPESDVALTAKFNIYNQIEDGSLEANNADTLAYMNSNVVAAANGGNNTVAAVPTGSSAQHGANALYCAPATAVNTNRYNPSFPVTVEKNTEYAFHLSYYSVDTAYTGYVTLLAKENFTNCYTANAKIPTYTYHWEKEGATNMAAWSVAGATATAGTTYQILAKETHATVNAGANTWVDFWFVFNSGDDASIFADGQDTGVIYLAFGVGNTATNKYYIDNISFAKTSATSDSPLTVKASDGGSVKYDGTTAALDSVYYANYPGKNGAVLTSADITGTAYSASVTNTGAYTATADAGYVFAGWYDKDDNLVSDKATTTFYSNGTYTALFVEGTTAPTNPCITKTVAEKNGDIAGGYVKGSGITLSEKGDSVTVEAVPYYGNTFAGWYNGETFVSKMARYTFTAEESQKLTAKFNVINLIPDGSFEANNGDATTYFNKQYTAPNGGQNAIAAVPTGSSAQHGANALYCAPATANNQNSDLLNLPFTAEKNTDYVLHFSYYSVDAALPAYISLHADNGSGAYTNAWTKSANLANYSYHWEPEGVTNYAAWTGAGTSVAEYAHMVREQTHQTINGGANTWVDVWVVFNSGSDASIFKTGEDTGDMWFALGVGNTATNKYYIDNVSLTKAGTSAVNKLTVIADSNGSVTYNDSTAVLNPAYYLSTAGDEKISGVTTPNIPGAKNGTTLDQQLVENGTRYSQAVTNTGSYTAKGNTGYVFDKWIDENGTTVSTNATEVFYGEGKYTAVFIRGMSASDGGSITQNPDKTYTATANAGYVFVGWVDENGTLVHSDATTTTAQIGQAYTAKFAKIIDCGEGGYMTTTDNNTYTAKAYYGNTFVGWVDAFGVTRSTDATISLDTLSGVVATFNKYNVIKDGGFDNNENEVYHKDATKYGSSEVLNEDGNNFLRLTVESDTTTDTAYLYGFQWNFKLEQGKKYLISYDLRAATDASGNYLSTDGMGFRRIIVKDAGGHSYPWSALKFASQSLYISGSKSNFYTDNVLLLPNGAAAFAGSTETGDAAFPGSFTNEKTDWTNYAIVVDTATATLADGTPIVNSDGTIDLGMCFGMNNAKTGKLVLDIDNIVISEVTGEYIAQSANAASGTATADRRYATNGLPATLTATANDGNAFYAWYKDGNKVSTEPIIKSTDSGIVSGTYTAKFIGAPYAGEGGRIVSEGNGVITATPYYGNTFLGWYGPENNQISTDATIDMSVAANQTTYLGAEARFVLHNKVNDGSFDDNKNNIVVTNKLDPTADPLPETYNTTEVLEEANGNKFLRIKSVTTGSNFHGFQYNFKLETGKTYVISYKLRPGFDASGNLLSSDGANFRRIVAAKKDVGSGFVWDELKFASQTLYIDGSAKSSVEENTNLQPAVGTVVTPVKNNGGYPGLYANNEGEWVTYTLVLDASTITFSNGSNESYDANTNLVATLVEGGVADLALTFGANAAGTLVFDIDDIVVSEYSGRYEVASKDDAKGTVAINQKFATPGITAVMTATANDGYDFYRWYDANGNVVSDKATIKSTDTGIIPGTYTAKFIGNPCANDGGYVTIDTTENLATAIPYYGNEFDHWTDKDGNFLTYDTSIAIDANQGAEANFVIHNKVDDGNFDANESNIKTLTSDDTVELKTDSDGNKYLRLTSTAAAARWNAYQFGFTAEKDKTYIITYKLRAGSDANGVNLNSSDMSFRRFVVPQNASGGYDWKKLTFASQIEYIVGSKATDTHEDVDMQPAAGTTLNPLSGGNYTDNNDEWVTYTLIIDTSSAIADWDTNVKDKDGNQVYDAAGNKVTEHHTESIIKDDGTMDIGLTFSVNTAGTMVIDIDDVLISEAAPYTAKTEDEKGGTVWQDTYASTATIPVTMWAYPNSEEEYFFVGWYNAAGTQVSTSEVLSSYDVPAGTYTAKFIQQIAASDGGTIVNNGDGTYTATAFYGNTFLGWYLNGIKVSGIDGDECTIKADDSNKGVIAKFSNDNLIYNGDFEKGSIEKTEQIYNNYVDYSTAVPGYKYVVPTCIADSGAEYGNYALELVPNTEHDGDVSPVWEKEEDGKTDKLDSDGNRIPVWETDEDGNYVLDPDGNRIQKTVPSTTKDAKIKSLLNIPVTLKAGETYLWKFAYTYLANYDANKHQLNFSIDKETGKNKPLWENTVDYSYHSQLASYTNDKTDITKNVDDYIWSWGRSHYTNAKGEEIKANYLNTKNASGGYEWVDLYVTFTAEEDGIYYLTLGTLSTCVDSVIVDNMSLTTVFDGKNLTTAVAGDNGTVSSYRADVPAFKATLASGTGVFTENKPAKEGEKVDYPGISVDKNKPMYAKMYVTYYAQPDLGYTFDGWYKNGKKVSDEMSLTVYSQGDGNYTAKFKYDPNKYYLTAEVVKEDGIYGGYITSDTTFTELLKYQKVTVSAKPYTGNLFAGWYDEDGNHLSGDTEFTYTVKENTKVFAYFAINNKFTDSGYENTKQNAVILGEGKEWTSDYADASGNAIALYSKDGKLSANLSANGYDIRHANMAVEANANYHLAFNWMLSVADTKEAPAKLEYVKVYAEDGTLLAQTNAAVAAKGVDSWQKVVLNFNTQNATSVYFVLKYSAKIASIYVDDLVLVNSDTTPFIVNLELEKFGDIYPGYILGESELWYSYGDEAYIEARGYEGNNFIGWYKDGELASENLEYTFKVNEFATYVAKFEVNNLIVDSGFENSELEQSLSDLGLWSVKESLKEDYGFDVFVSSDRKQPFTGSNGEKSEEIWAYDGWNVLRVNHRNNTFSTTATGLEENTNYVFSFWWRIQNTSELDEDTSYTAFFQSAKLTGNKTKAELGAGRAVGVGAPAKSEWQKVYIPFNSGNNTEMAIDLCYNTGSGYCFIDDFSVYKADYVTLVAGDGGYIYTDFNGGVSGPAKRGTEITVSATPDPGNTFLGWYDYGNPNKLISKDATYKFTVNGSVALIALFDGPNVRPVNWFIDGDFENYYMTAPTFDHPNFTSEWCSYGVTTSVGDILPVSGNNFLLLNSHSRYTNFLVSNLEPATTYTMSFWYNAGEYYNVGSVTVYERYFEYERRTQEDKGATYVVNAARNYSRVDTYEYSIGAVNLMEAPSGEWRKAEFTFTTTNRREVYIHIEHSRAAASNGGLYLDDVRIEKRSGGYTDTVVDGNFEQITAIDGWNGPFSIIENNGNTYGHFMDEIYNNINLNEVRPYVLTFKARSDTNSELMFGITRGGETSLVADDGKINAISGAAYDTVKTTNEWKTYKLTFTAAGFFQYSLFFKSLGEFIDIDDVSVSLAKELVNAEKVTFEDTENIAINNSLLYAVNKDNPGNWQGMGYNKAFYEISDVAHSGSHSLVMHEKPITDSLTKSQEELYKEGGNYLSHPLFQDFSAMMLRPGKTYTLTYWAKAEKAGTQFSSHVINTDKDWTWHAIADDVITLDSTKWTKITQTFTTLETMNTRINMATFVVNSIKGKTKGDIYFDDIVITETANSVTNAEQKLLYTQDMSQNYIVNYNFETTEGDLGKYAVADSDAFYGEKVGSFKAGDKLIMPITTRTDYNIEFASEYTLAASIRGDSSAKGYVALAYAPDGSDLISKADGTPMKLAVNTDGKWERTGFTFSDFRNVTVYLVIVCESGSFSLDHLALFNENHSYEVCQDDLTVDVFDKENSDNYVDMGTLGTTHNVEGVISGLPEGSKVVLVSPDAVYTADVDADGDYLLEDVANDTYDMYIAASDATHMTLWGDLTLTPTTISGLACERLNTEITNITGEGVRNGIVKIIDDETGWAYLTATDENGQFNAYIGSEYWYIEGTTNIAEVLEDSRITLDQFKLEAAAATAAAN